ncbi:hypothetical protein [Streptomyces hyaluromycini]|uniref:hypothetical protein n=1 Tax=Streptomyces hyaluromycini TaxID=1377993 RepID=UPI003D9E82E2
MALMQAEFDERGFGWWALEARETGEFIGRAGLDEVGEDMPFTVTNGACCLIAGGGTTTREGKRVDCGCDNDGYLYGYPNKTAAVWNISYPAPGSDTSVSTPITKMYQ